MTPMAQGNAQAPSMTDATVKTRGRRRSVVSLFTLSILVCCCFTVHQLFSQRLEQYLTSTPNLLNNHSSSSSSTLTALIFQSNNNDVTNIHAGVNATSSTVETQHSTHMADDEEQHPNETTSSDSRKQQVVAVLAPQTSNKPSITTPPPPPLQRSQQAVFNNSSLEQLSFQNSQYIPRRVFSRSLCHALSIYGTKAPPHQSPNPFPRILTSDGTTTATTSCRSNAILYLVQKGKHSSYNRNSTALLLKSLDLLYRNYLSIHQHYDNVDVLLFHSGDYTLDDLQFLNARYNQTVHFKLIDLSRTEYWKVPDVVRHDNISNWVRATDFSMGYRHMIRWYSLKLYDFLRDYANRPEGCSYQYLMRLDEDSYIHSSIDYDMFDLMKERNYVYAYRVCTYEMELEVWDDYEDHVKHCGIRWPKGVPFRKIEEGLCSFYSNFFIIDLAFVQQPHVQHFLNWVDALGIIYRDRYGDLNVQALAVYAFAPAKRIHRFLDWTYEHMTHSALCPMWGVLQAGYMDPHPEIHFDAFVAEHKLEIRNCPMRTKSLFRKDLSPTYAHRLPPSSWFMEKYGKKRRQFKWKTFAKGKAERANQGLLSG